MPDQIIDAAMARTLHADTSRDHPMVGWVVMHGLPEYPGKVIARLVTSGPPLTCWSPTPAPGSMSSYRSIWCAWSA